MMAVCSALTLENPVPAAAALSPPNSRISVVILRPIQVAAPGVPPNGAKAHAAPIEALSPGPPTIMVLPSPEIDTDQPCSGPKCGPNGRKLFAAPVPTNFSC